MIAALLDIAQYTGMSFAFLLLVFYPMERVFPAKAQQKFLRSQWFLDLTFFLGQYFFWGSLVLLVLATIGQYAAPLIPNALRSSIQEMPFLLQALLVLLLSDFLIYWGHRLQHSMEFLWRFHKVHHSVIQMDWLAAHREHPVDSIYTIGIVNLPAFVLGFPLESIAGVVAFRGIWAIYIHANVRLPIGPLRLFIGAPELHHWHHDLDRRAGNYANIFPLMDVLFGTYQCPNKEPESFGIPDPAPQTYVGQLIEPLLPQYIWQKLLTLTSRYKRK
jgi:sterol desaturase/sphingolipid hydroxylase (fatty acid hydroxylase superfamily)